jgi:ATP-binding cassette subfamily B protein
VTGVLAPVETYAVKLIIDGITDHRASRLVIAGAILIGSLAYRFLYRAAMGPPIGATTRDRIYGYLHTDLIRLTTHTTGIEHHERPDIADRIELLHKEAGNMSFNVQNVLSVSIATAASVIAIVALLGSVHPILLLLPLIGMLRVWAGLTESRMRFQARERSSKYSRFADRLGDIAQSPRHGLELRVFDLRTMLLQRLDALWQRIATERLHAAHAGMAYQVGSRLVFGISYAVAIAFLTHQAVNGKASAGDVALVVLLGSRIDQTANQLTGTTLEAGETIRLFSHYAWLRRYARDAASAESTGPAPDDLTDGITLRGVGFQYPGTSDPILHDLDLHLPAGATIALVGENGAGKTTLIKLLARLYDPTTGTVHIDNHDLRDIEPTAWRQRISATFQDFVTFEFTAGETVGIGDLLRIDDPHAITDALRRGDATSIVDALPAGPRTQLGSRFTNGVDLSGGQWQRLALARGFMRTKPLLLILDEPTAALDPESEHALFEHFTQASRETSHNTGGITILVSHRFSTVKMADLIVVLHQARITETGSHTELLAAHGRYAELFNLQAHHYR